MTKPQANPLSIKSGDLLSKPQLDRDAYREMQEERPVQLKPEDELNLRSTHQKQLFHGWLKAKWGFMPPFNQMYNEGLALLSSKNITITLGRMDRFMHIMQQTYYPEEEPRESLKPRAFQVEYLGLEITMTIAQVCRNWPILSVLVNDPKVDEFTVVLSDERITVKRLDEVELEAINP